MNNKKCPVCENLLDLNCFSKKNTKCKKCKAEKQKEFRFENKKSKELYLTNMLHKAKARAKKRGLKFNLSIEDLRELAVEECPVLGLRLTYERYRETSDYYNSASLDRISNEGYEKGKVRIISNRANTLKSNADPIETLKVLKYQLDYAKKEDLKDLKKAIEKDEEISKMLKKLYDSNENNKSKKNPYAGVKRFFACPENFE